eukprot:TRINITY_DN514_c14_g1_i1.p1 TRINITY_DN514_c14_g1~~TRINITY_DN514_c14_g1_i1.p1  ORF type:complete len:843 (+),score=126.43 TRINITY_DN514_c14_g1_i1:39-2531(+)
MIRRGLAQQMRWKGELPSHAKVVVVGGGIIGNSVAYHLTKEGWNDVVVLEKGTATCGTTWHAAGLIGQLRGTSQETALSKMGAETFRRLLKETDQDTGFKQHGSITLSRCPDRTTLLKRNAARAGCFGIEASIITAEDAAERFPTLDPSIFECALWLPNDGVASPTDVTNAFMKGAKQGGAKVFENTTVTGFIKNKRNGLVEGVETSNGTIGCEYVINCSGLWSNQVGKMAGVCVPLHACEHFYVVTDTINGIHGKLPVLRDPDQQAYYREWSGGIVLGGFELKAKPCFLEGPPESFEFQLLEDDFEHFYPVIEGAFEAMPILKDTNIRNMVNGPESFTPDNQYILGESPECENFWVAAGMNSSGIASSTGAGWALAKWLTHPKKQPPFDLSAVDIKRFGHYANSQNFVRTRSSETLGMHYTIPYPRFELEQGRPLRTSPLYDTLKDSGAVFGSKFGWERANYFNTNAHQADPTVYSFEKPAWMEIVNNEVIQTTTKCSIFDVSSFSKFSIQGKDAEKFCDFVCGANMSIEINDLIYTSILNDKGGYISDVTVTRIASDHFYVVAPTTHATKDLSFLRQRAAEYNFCVGISDTTGATGVLAVQGPLSNKVLSESCGSPKPYDFESIKPNSSAIVEIGNHAVRVSRVSYVGQLGVEIHCPIEQLKGVYDRLIAHPEASNAGYYCIEALRIAAGYRAWGHEMTTDDTPVHVGTSFAFDFSNKNGISGTVLHQLKEDGVANLDSRIISVRMSADSETVLWGGETVLRDGVVVGYLTSGSYVKSLSTSVGLATIKNQGMPLNNKFLKSGDWSVNVAGELYPIHVSFKPPRDIVV